MSEEALKLARSMNDPEAEAKTLWHLGLLGRLTAQDAEAIGYFEESLAIAEEHDLEEQIGFTLTDLYWSYLVEGHLDTSRETVERANRTWTKRGTLPMVVDTLAGKVFVLYLAGQFQEAIETAKEALELSEKIDNLWGRSYSQAYLGFVQIELGEISAAFETMQRSIALGIQAGFFVPGVLLPSTRAITRARLGGGVSDEPLVLDSTPENFKRTVAPLIRMVEAEIHIHNMELEQAREILDEVVKEPALMTTVYLEFPIEATQARYAQATGDYEQVVQVTTAAIDKLGRRGVVCHLPMFYHLRAKALLAQGDKSGAIEDLNRGLAYTKESGARFPTWELLGLRAQLLEEGGDHAGAQQDLNAAAEMVGFITDHIEEEELRASFLAKPDVSAILVKASRE